MRSGSRIVGTSAGGADARGIPDVSKSQNVTTYRGVAAGAVGSRRTTPVRSSGWPTQDFDSTATSRATSGSGETKTAPPASSTIRAGEPDASGSYRPERWTACPSYSAGDSASSVAVTSQVAP